MIVEKGKLVFLFILYTLQCAAQPQSYQPSLWFDANKNVNCAETNVVSWNDISGHNRHAITKTTDYPRLIPHAINNLPAIRFNGVNNGMETPLFENFPNKRGTIFLVVKINGNSATSGVGVSNIISTYHGTGPAWQFCSSVSDFSFYDGKLARTILMPSYTPTEWGIVSLVRRNDTTIEIYGGGRFESSITVTNNQPVANTLKIGFNGRLGGTATDSIPEVLNGDIAEIIIYYKALLPAQLSSVHQYLAQKYSLELRPLPYWQRWWFYCLLILLLIPSVMLMIQYVQQRKLKDRLKVLEKQQAMDKERQRISREMHDDIGAGLTQITMMSESLMNKHSTTPGKELEDIAATSRQLVRSMSEIIWTLHPDNRTLEQLISYLREQLYQQLEYSTMAYDIQLPAGGNDIELSKELQRNLLLVTKEIVNNAIKYSRASKILVKMDITEQLLYCSIEDNGIGFDLNHTSFGNGLKNIRKRVEELGGTINLQSALGTGTTINYVLPLLQ